MVRWILAGMALVVAGGAAALLAGAPEGGGPAAPDGTPEARLDFVRQPLAEVVRAIAARTGQRIAFRPEAAGRQEVTMSLTDAGADLLLKRFGEALDRLDLALVRDADPARGWSVIAFNRVPASAAGPEAEPFVVRVVEGRVRLQSGGASVDVAAGEEGLVAAGGQLLAARQIDPRAVALWRGGGAPAVAGARSADAPNGAFRVVGTTEEGQWVVEWSAPGAATQRTILEKGAREFRIPLKDRDR